MNSLVFVRFLVASVPINATTFLVTCGPGRCGVGAARWLAGLTARNVAPRGQGRAGAFLLL
jgi:hypothetical protein